MGFVNNNYAQSHFNVANKHTLNWIEDSRILQLHPHGDHNNCVQCVSSGVFTLTAFDNLYNNDNIEDENIFSGFRWKMNDVEFIPTNGVPILEQKLQSSIRSKGDFFYGGVRSLLREEYEVDGEIYYGGVEIIKAEIQSNIFPKTYYHDFTDDTVNLLDGVILMIIMKLYVAMVIINYFHCILPIQHQSHLKMQFKEFQFHLKSLSLMLLNYF